MSGSNQRAARELRLRTALLQHLTAQTCTGTEVNVRVQSLTASGRVSSYDSNLLPVFYRWQLRVVWQVGSKVAGRTLVSRVDTEVPYLTDGRKNEELETVFLERLVAKAVRDLSWQMISLEHEYAADLT